MVNSVGFTQWNCPEKQDTKAEKLRSHWKLKERSVAVVNRI